MNTHPSQEAVMSEIKRKSDVIGDTLWYVNPEDIREAFTTYAQTMMEEGRLSVLKDFDNMCHADAFVGFTSEEWSAVKKFFEFNKQISGWDTPTTNHTGEK